LGMTRELLTDCQRVEALVRFGYTARQAEFLSCAALHSGYFVRRQCEQFLGNPSRETASTFIDKLFANEHGKCATYAEDRHLYHLCSRPLYAALGEPDNRNRRDRQPLTIKGKLMALDFVLAHPEERYLATETEKVRHFTDTFKINR